MGLPTYATVEQLMAATDFKTSAYLEDRLLRELKSASRKIEKRYLRHFYPKTETREYVSPDTHSPDTASSTGFFLDGDLLSLTSVTVDGSAKSNVELWPKPWGPPYSWIGVTGTDITIVGVWGFTQDTDPAGALAEALDASETDVDVTDGSKTGIGDLLIVDSERMIVEGKTNLDTGQTLQSDMAAQDNDVTVAVSTGSAFNVGEVILLDSERMKIVDIAGNNLTVRRRWSGSVLAAHSGSSIYAARRLTVERGALGSTAATHSTAASIVRNVAPGPIVDLCIAEAIHTFEQESSGYGKTVGSGDNEREARGHGLGDARKQANHYRRQRVASV